MLDPAPLRCGFSVAGLTIIFFSRCVCIKSDFLVHQTCIELGMLRFLDISVGPLPSPIPISAYDALGPTLGPFDPIASSQMKKSTTL
jgi:hypothetical protein